LLNGQITPEKVPLKIKAALLDRDLNLKPVCNARFTVQQPAPTAAVKFEIVTDFEGRGEIRVPPGRYRLTSTQPSEFQDKKYSWDVEVSVAGPETFVILSNENARAAAVAVERTSAYDDYDAKSKHVDVVSTRDPLFREASPLGHAGQIDRAMALPRLPKSLLQNPTGHKRYTSGDVFVAIGDGQVDEFTPAAQLVQTLDDLSGSTYTAGMAFDTKGELYLTNFSIGTISRFDMNGNLVNPEFISNQVTNESISMPGGQFPMLVGDADLHDNDGNGIINQYDYNGNLLNSYHVQVENRGTDWIDLQTDGHTVLYTSEGQSILSYDIATQTQNPPFATGLPGSYAYAHRTLTSGPFSGDVLVADSEFALLVAPGGAIMQTYFLPGNSGNDFAISLSLDGNSFYTADYTTGEIWQVEIQTGAILQEWNSGYGSAAGLAIFQEPGQGGSPFLEFPLMNRTPYNAQIISVFDHSMGTAYCANDTVTAYDGEQGWTGYGRADPVFYACNGKRNPLFSFAQNGHQPFSINGQYVGEGGIYLNYDGHPGFDFRTTDQNRTGEIPVLAAAEGNVVCVRVPQEPNCHDMTLVQYCHEGPGEIKIDHGNGYYSIYLHLSSSSVVANQHVSAGQQIGVSGDTGVCGSPHLHFEVRVGIAGNNCPAGQCVPVDPYGWTGQGTDPYTRALNLNLWLQSR
jgi:murein DD-endopeptidase MepM/ murein hydrolase activator NlpD